jgi:hypothetical protein
MENLDEIVSSMKQTFNKTFADTTPEFRDWIITLTYNYILVAYTIGQKEALLEARDVMTGLEGRISKAIKQKLGV